MLGSFQTIIFREVDDDDETGKRGVWVRISPSNWGVTIENFKDQPTVDTPESEAMSAVHYDPCFADKTKITAWDEYTDSESGGGEEVVLVESVDNWKPRE